MGLLPTQCPLQWRAFLKPSSVKSVDHTVCRMLFAARTQQSSTSMKPTAVSVAQKSLSERGFDFCGSTRSHNRRYSSFFTESRDKIPYWPILGAGAVLFLLAYLLGRRKTEDDDVRVFKSVKRQLLKAERMVQKGNYVEAEKACHKALGLVMGTEQAEKKSYLETRAVTMDKLANIYFEQMKLTEAEMMFKETLIIMLNLGTAKDDDSVIEISLKLAKIYNNQKKYEEAETGLEWCVETARKKLDAEKSSQRYGMLGLCLQTRAQYHQMHKNHHKAIEDFSETVDIAKAMENPLQVATAYSNLATAVDGARDYQKAVSLLNKSLDLLDQISSQQKESQLSSDRGEAAEGNSEGGGGSAHQSEEDYSESKLDYYRAVFRTNLGMIHSNNGHPDLALAEYERAEELAKKHGDQLLMNQIHFGQMRTQKTSES